jgi:hypothetical protein
MADITNLNPETQSKVGQRQRSEVRFPSYSLADSVAVAKFIHDKGGGKATPDALAAYLGYKSTANGAYLARAGAARMFGIIMKAGDFFTLSPLAQQILMPTYAEQARQALVDAFLNIDLFKRVFDDFKGKELPPEFGMKNALRNTYRVVPNRIDVAYRVLMESAESAGFFETRGARTHLIMPPLQPVSTPTGLPTDSETREGSNKPGGGSGDGVGGSGQTRTLTLDAVKARYVQTLINVLEEKGKQGELDEALMTRIEKLLEIR